MKAHFLFLTVSLLVAAPVAASSHQAHAPAAGKGAPTTSSSDVFASYDKNKDGWLSRAELAAHPMAAHAGMVDADKDGRLSRAEFRQLQSM